jgi:hypothetical protein
MRITFPQPALGWVARSDHTVRQNLGGVGGEGEKKIFFANFARKINVFKCDLLPLPLYFILLRTQMSARGGVARQLFIVDGGKR